MSENVSYDYVLAPFQPTKPAVTVTRTGVLAYEEDILRCNSEDVVCTAMAEVGKLRPKEDWHGHFAGRVTITVELLGDLESAE